MKTLPINHDAGPEIGWQETRSTDEGSAENGPEVNPETYLAYYHAECGTRVGLDHNTFTFLVKDIDGERCYYCGGIIGTQAAFARMEEDYQQQFRDPDLEPELLEKMGLGAEPSPKYQPLTNREAYDPDGIMGEVE